MIDINKLVEFKEELNNLNEKFMTYEVIDGVFKSKVQKAIDDGNTNKAEVYLDVFRFCVDKENELLCELKVLNDKVANL